MKDFDWLANIHHEHTDPRRQPRMGIEWCMFDNSQNPSSNGLVSCPFIVKITFSWEIRFSYLN